MSRDFAKVLPQFWTGETGRWLRKQGAEVQVVSLYLLTCPTANMIGLYYLPIPTLCHETGLSREGALKALQRVSEGGFAYYDEAREEVWVPQMARYQVGELLKSGDHKIVGVRRLLADFEKSRFHEDFLRLYERPFRLSEESEDKDETSPLKGAPKPLPSKEKEKEKEKDLFEQPSAARPRFDLLAIYERYPNKKGKAKGLEKLKALVNTQADYEAVMLGVASYAEEVKRNRTEPKYVKHFDAWVNGRRWEDYAAQHSAEARGTDDTGCQSPTALDRIKAREAAERAGGGS